MKSFRVGMDERCINVLPIALRKYRIKDDWRQYSLYIVHGDQERCLGLEEKPLLLFKQLSQAGRKPMFMLRRHATPSVGFDRPLTMDVTSPGLAPANGASATGARNSAMSSTVQLPGGVL